MDLPGGARVVDVGSVERQLAELWRESAGSDQAVMRACMLNLVVACAGSGDLAAVSRAVAGLSERYPGRALVVSHESGDDVPGGDDGTVEIHVSARCHRGPGGKQVCSEQISFEARGEAWRLIPSTLLGLLVEDCPVYTWWRRPQLTGDPLFVSMVEPSDRFIVDSAAAADPAGALSALAALVGDETWRGNPGDLAWARVEPWCALVASLFDLPETRGYLDQIDAVELVTGGPGCGERVTLAGAYLAGWLASRLGWRSTDRATVWERGDGAPARIRCAESRSLGRGEIGAVRLEAAAGAAPAVFQAARLAEDGEVVGLSIESKGTRPLPYKQRVAGRDELSLLSGQLESDPGDPLFIAALAAASRIAGNPANDEGGSPK